MFDVFQESMKVFLIALLLVATTSAIGGDEASIKAVFDGKHVVSVYIFF
jgi:hypothetical protein